MGCGIFLFKKWNRPDSLLVFTGWQLLAGGLLLAVATARFEPMTTHFGLRNGLALIHLVFTAQLSRDG